MKVLLVVGGNTYTYTPIVDYYYIEDECLEVFEVMNVVDVISEMEYQNEIIK